MQGSILPNSILLLSIFVVFNKLVYDWFQYGDISLNGFPQLLGTDSIITMYQHMTHPLYIVPINLIVSVPIFLCQHINRLPDDFYVFYITIENNRIGHHLFKRM